MLYTEKLDFTGFCKCENVQKRRFMLDPAADVLMGEVQIRYSDVLWQQAQKARLCLYARPGPIMAFRFSTKQFDTLYDARVNRFALSPAARMIYTVDVESTGEPIQTKLRRFELDRPSATLQTADLQFQPAIVAVNGSHLIVSEVKPFGLHEYNWETGEDTVLPARSDSFALCGDSLFYLQENDALYCLNLKVTEDALLIAEEVACFAILQEKYLFYSTNEQRDWYSQAPFEKIMELKPAA